MKTPQKHNNAPGKKLPEKGKTEGREDRKATEENCRCQEVSKKTVPELLRIMISDLAFWKKGK